MHTLIDLLHQAGASPTLQAVLIILATFILEDAATVMTAMQVQSGSIDGTVGLSSLYVGIVLGDMGLYGLGALAAKWPPARRWVTLPKQTRRQEWFQSNVMRAVVISRFIPGARLPVYTACGFFSAGLLRFTLSAIAATLIWTSLLFGVSLRVGQFVIDHFGTWRWAGIAGFAATIIVINRLVARLQNRTS